MGHYEDAYWQATSWGADSRERAGGAYHPYVPDTISDADILLTPQAASAAAQAQADMAVLNATTSHLNNTEPLARLILRSEAVSSSRIEGLEMRADRLLEYEALDELGINHRVDATEAAVLANISAMQQAVTGVASHGEIDVDTICDVNRTLLEDTDLAACGGILRSTQNWIGGSSLNPLDAAYVPPKAEHIPVLMDDLARFINTSGLPPVAVAAVAHAQLETIHPFADGNGRTGRALVHMVLRQKGLAPAVVPPVSLVLAADKSRYIAELSTYRYDESDAGTSLNGCLCGWIEYFSNALSESCARAAEFESILSSIEQTWRERVNPRAGSAADVLLGKLVGNPVVSVTSAARLTGKSYEAARKAVGQLMDAGVLTQNARNRKSDLYVANDVIDAFTRYERSLATESGDTSVEKPGRPVPQRVRRRDR